MSVVILDEKQTVVYYYISSHANKLLRSRGEPAAADQTGRRRVRRASAAASVTEKDYLAAVLSPVMMAASVLQDNGDLLESVDVNGTTMDFVYFCQYTIVLFGHSRLCCKKLLSEVSLLIVQELRLLAGPSLDSLSTTNKIKLDRILQSLLPLAFSQDARETDGRKMIGATKFAPLDETRQGWWLERADVLIKNIKENNLLDGGSGLFSQTSSSALHLIFFNSDLDLLYCHSAAASENSKSRLPLRDIQVYMRAKYLWCPVTEGGLTGVWEDELELVFLNTLTPTFALFLQVYDMFVVFLSELEISKTLTSLLKTISGILFTKQDLWSSLSRALTYPVQLAKSTPLLDELRLDVLKNSVEAKNEQRLKSAYKELVADLARTASHNFKILLRKYRQAGSQLSLQRFLEARLKDPPAQVACTTLLSQSLDNILEVRVYNVHANRLIIIKIKDVRLRETLKPLPKSGRGLCESWVEIVEGTSKEIGTATTLSQRASGPTATNRRTSASASRSSRSSGSVSKSSETSVTSASKSPGTSGLPADNQGTSGSGASRNQETENTEPGNSASRNSAPLKAQNHSAHEHSRLKVLRLNLSYENFCPEEAMMCGGSTHKRGEGRTLSSRANQSSRTQGSRTLYSSANNKWISVLAIFSGEVDLDLGSLSLFFVKFVKDHLLQALLDPSHR